VINISFDGVQSSGLKQFYFVSSQLEKLLSQCHKARVDELGRHAALEYERVTRDDEDYLVSVKRIHQTFNVLSLLKPLRLFLKIDPMAAGV
jgi:ABC-type enterochelin transport system substrate-binding protein